MRRQVSCERALVAARRAGAAPVLADMNEQRVKFVIDGDLHG